MSQEETPDQIVKEEAIGPCNGIVSFTIPVGNVPSSQVPLYLKEIGKNLDTSDLKKAGFVVYLLPVRPDGSGPKIDVYKFSDLKPDAWKHGV